MTVTGNGFALGTGTVIKFGTLFATGVNCTSTQSCTATSPAHKAGTVDVRAVVVKATSPKAPPGDQFTFF